MIKKINLAGFFCRSFYLQKQCRVLGNSVSTSAVFNRKEDINFQDLKTRDFMKNQWEKYEDTFGNIENFEAKFQHIKDDPEDILEYKRVKEAPGKTAAQYVKEVKVQLMRNNYRAALKLLEVDMRNDKIKDTHFIYKVLICHNAKMGNLEEAYRLFIDFKKRGGIVSGAMYTSMFNACANCKNSFLAMKRAEAVEECMYRNQYHRVNVTNYNAMMKAYGRHGDMQKCLQIMDEVLGKREKIHDISYAFLLQACITDVNSGFRHALIVWRKMLQNDTRPTLPSFNLMLRCIRDCSLGEILLIPDAIKQILHESKFFYKRKLKIKKIGDRKTSEILKIPVDGSKVIASLNKNSESQEKSEKNFITPNALIGKIDAEQNTETSESCIVKDETENHLSGVENEGDSIVNVEKDEQTPSTSGEFKLPNLLAMEPTIGSVIDFNRISTPQDRFMLVGGVEGFLKTMDEFNVKPDVKTFTLLVNLIPQNKESEEKLIAISESYNVQLDIGFFNALLRSRIFRNDPTLINDCLDKMRTLNLKPDILTFGVLALNCNTHELGIEFLENLHRHGFRANTVIINILIKAAMELKDMNYVLTVLKAAKEDDVELSPKSLAIVSRIVEEEKHKKHLKDDTALKSA